MSSLQEITPKSGNSDLVNNSETTLPANSTNTTDDIGRSPDFNETDVITSTSNYENDSSNICSSCKCPCNLETDADISIKEDSTGFIKEDIPKSMETDSTSTLDEMAFKVDTFAVGEKEDTLKINPNDKMFNEDVIINVSSLKENGLETVDNKCKHKIYLISTSKYYQRYYSKAPF